LSLVTSQRSRPGWQRNVSTVSQNIVYGSFYS
jgi:hypothetical protein